MKMKLVLAVACSLLFVTGAEAASQDNAKCGKYNANDKIRVRLSSPQSIAWVAVSYIDNAVDVLWYDSGDALMKIGYHNGDVKPPYNTKPLEIGRGQTRAVQVRGINEAGSGQHNPGRVDYRLIERHPRHGDRTLLDVVCKDDESNNVFSPVRIFSHVISITRPRR